MNYSVSFAGIWEVLSDDLEWDHLGDIGYGCWGPEWKAHNHIDAGYDTVVSSCWSESTTFPCQSGQYPCNYKKVTNRSASSSLSGSANSFLTPIKTEADGYFTPTSDCSSDSNHHREKCKNDSISDGRFGSVRLTMTVREVAHDTLRSTSTERLTSKVSGDPQEHALTEERVRRMPKISKSGLLHQWFASESKPFADEQDPNCTFCDAAKYPKLSSLQIRIRQLRDIISHADTDRHSIFPGCRPRLHLRVRQLKESLATSRSSANLNAIPDTTGLCDNNKEHHDYIQTGESSSRDCLSIACTVSDEAGTKHKRVHVDPYVSLELPGCRYNFEPSYGTVEDESFRQDSPDDENDWSTAHNRSLSSSIMSYASSRSGCSYTETHDKKYSPRDIESPNTDDGIFDNIVGMAHPSGILQSACDDRKENLISCNHEKIDYVKNTSNDILSSSSTLSSSYESCAEKAPSNKDTWQLSCSILQIAFLSDSDEISQNITNKTESTSSYESFESDLSDERSLYANTSSKLHGTALQNTATNEIKRYDHNTHGQRWMHDYSRNDNANNAGSGCLTVTSSRKCLSKDAALSLSSSIIDTTCTGEREHCEIQKNENMIQDSIVIPKQCQQETISKDIHLSGTTDMLADNCAQFKSVSSLAASQLSGDIFLIGSQCINSEKSTELDASVRSFLVDNHIKISLSKDLQENIHSETDVSDTSEEKMIIQPSPSITESTTSDTIQIGTKIMYKK